MRFVGMAASAVVDGAELDDASDKQMNRIKRKGYQICAGQDNVHMW